MQVFVVWFSNFHSQDELVGIYLTREAAQQRIEGFCKQDQGQMRVEDYSLDD